MPKNNLIELLEKGFDDLIFGRVMSEEEFREKYPNSFVKR